MIPLVWSELVIPDISIFAVCLLDIWQLFPYLNTHKLYNDLYPVFCEICVPNAVFY